ncbi:MAG: hypothetical protein IID16_00755 [Candidatus Marinimicrobia bacterium]|nr:hypothetical protein [Candidatus Neomarinimicrobiota bacterium]
MSTLIYLLVIGTFVLIDWYFIERRETELNKPMTWSIRAVVTISFALLAKNFNLHESLLYACFLAFLFYSCFDYGLNLARGKPFFHKGKNPIDGIIPAGIPDLAFKMLTTGGMYIVYQWMFFDCVRLGPLEKGYIEELKWCWHLLI